MIVEVFEDDRLLHEMVRSAEYLLRAKRQGDWLGMHAGFGMLVSWVEGTRNEWKRRNNAPPIVGQSEGGRVTAIGD